MECGNEIRAAKILRKWTLAVLVMLAVACIMTLPSFAESAGKGYDSAPSLTVVEEGGRVPDFIDGAWSLDGGTYAVSGTARNYEGLRIAGDVTLDLRDATIIHAEMDTWRYGDIAQYAPAINIESGSVRMNLVGENAVKGSPGYAGVHVAEGATLAISGAGSLAARGGDACNTEVRLPDRLGAGKEGYFTGGAGIGGNGVWMAFLGGNPNICEAISGHSLAFGAIRIDGGTISAAGGDLLNRWNLGAGAGIGAGGAAGVRTNQSDPIGFPFAGTITINGGDVTATGGDTAPTDTGGGAGIGSGGVTGNFYWPYSSRNDIRILIGGGTVVAAGEADGAGIGGGANVNGGTIEISGGFVKAQGGDEEDGTLWGGAGIGGGEECSATSILIDGGIVSAAGGGAASGIGSGNGGGTHGTLTLAGSAEVDAHGGPERNGGAGIMAGGISLEGSAHVRVYAGGRARGIVSGMGEGLALSDTAALWVQTDDASSPAISSYSAVPGQVLGNVSYSSLDAYLTTNYNYANGTIEDAVAYGWLTTPSSLVTGDRGFEYTWDDGGLRIDGNAVPLSTDAMPVGGSWATLYREILSVIVSYQYVSSVPEGVVAPNPVEVAPGTAYIPEKPESFEGWVFDGWYTDEKCIAAFIDGTVLDSDVVLYGRWLRTVVPIKPQPVVPGYTNVEGDASAEGKSFQGVFDQEARGSIVLSETGDAMPSRMPVLVLVLFGSLLVLAFAIRHK